MNLKYHLEKIMDEYLFYKENKESIVCNNIFKKEKIGIESYLKENLNYGPNLLFKTSFGQKGSKWNKIPYIYIMDKRISENKNDLFNLGIFFHENMDSLYISLNLGTKGMAKKFKNEMEKIKWVIRKKFNLKQSNISLQDLTNNINTHTKPFEESSIVSIEYRSAYIDNDKLLLDIKNHLSIINDLYNISKNNWENYFNNIINEYEDYLELNYNELGIDDLICLANKDDDEAMLKLGDIYSNVGENHDPNKAFDWYKKAAEFGNHIAIRIVGEIYYYGSKYVEKDLNKAISYFEMVSSDNLYSLGKEVVLAIEEFHWNNKNYHLSKRYSKFLLRLEKDWFREYVESKDRLGIQFYKGLGVNKNSVIAEHLFNETAEQESAIGLYYSGLFLEQKREERQAIKHFQEAAKKGNKDALFKMSEYYIKGFFEDNNKFINRNFKKAYDYINEAKDENIEASKMIAEISNFNVNYDLKEEEKLFIITQKKENSSLDLKVILRKLAEYHEESKTFDRCLEVYGYAGKEGDMISKLRYAKLGQGCIDNETKIKLLREIEYEEIEVASKVEYTKLITGITNNDARIELLEKLSEIGIKEATYELAETYRGKRNIPTNNEKALYYHIKATELLHKKSFFWVGRFYEKGYGTEINLDKARYFYTLGKDFNQKKCIKGLKRLVNNDNRMEDNKDNGKI